MVKIIDEGFPGGAVVRNPPANAGDTGSSPGLGRSHMPRSNWAREPQLRPGVAKINKQILKKEFHFEDTPGLFSVFKSLAVKL